MQETAAGGGSAKMSLRRGYIISGAVSWGVSGPGAFSERSVPVH
jgi:hypothetical protein